MPLQAFIKSSLHLFLSYQLPSRAPLAAQPNDLLQVTPTTSLSSKQKLECVEIKCQLDATEVFIADLTACSTCFGHHYAHHQELKSIIQWSLPVLFRAVVFKLLVWCGAEGYVSGLQDAAHPTNRTHNPHLIGIVMPETC